MDIVILLEKSSSGVTVRKGSYPYRLKVRLTDRNPSLIFFLGRLERRSTSPVLFVSLNSDWNHRRLSIKDRVYSK